MTAPIIANWLGGIWALDVDGLVYAPGATLLIEPGDDYAHEESRSIQFVNTSDDWIPITGATPYLYIYLGAREVFHIEGTVLQATAPNQKIDFILLKTDSAKLRASGNPNYNYSAKVIFPNLHVVTLPGAEGKVTVS